MKKALQIMVLIALPFMVGAQQINGTVSDKDGPIIGATVSISSSNGVITDFDGKYQLRIPVGSHSVTISYIGYVTRKESVILASGESKTLNITLEENVELLQELVVVGTRSRPRSSIDTAVPVDILSSKDLTSSGQQTFDKALTYKVPSFNSVQTPVNDATSLLDPYEIRNMGPSRTLILINGKRKNLSALLYTQTSPGRGETGADISGIPTDAIERVEILRDGASAQYGSDAIAGVMNVILKDDVGYGSVTMRAGITGKGDGETVGMSLNSGVAIGERGFINYTVGLSKLEQSNRPSMVSAEGEFADFVYSKDATASENIAGRKKVDDFLADKPDAGNINGSPETTSSKFSLNGKFGMGEQSEVYFNGAYVYKNVNSFANYRTPYWRTLSDYPYLKDFFPAQTPSGYNGYVPTFDGLLNDYNATVGFKNEVNDWIYDGSFTVGGNAQTYKVNNTHNRNEVKNPSTYLGDLNKDGTVNILAWDTNEDGVVDPNEGIELLAGGNKYRENSPINFDVGGTRFSHIVGNVDISKAVSDNLGIAFGTEFRSETFTVIEGDEASYEGGGADSFAGNTPENSGKWNRYNVGAYLDLSYDASKDFLLNGTVRLENYSDFGQAFVWKVSTRYKLLEDRLTFRGSFSTGFRAPTLHQIYTQKAQYSFVPGQGVQVGGLVNNISPQAQFLGLPKLKAETSLNLTLGLGFRASENIDFTIDYYSIAMKDRIILSTEIEATEKEDKPLDDVLKSNNLSDVSFFVNAIDTKTSGLDVVVNYKAGDLKISLAGNYTIQNERDGAIKNPKLVEDASQSVLNATQEALFFTSRPKTKWILGVNYKFDKFDFSLNNTYFGKTEFRQQGLDKNLKTEFIPKIVSDLGVVYNVSESVSIAFNINNIFSVLPEWKFVALNGEGEKILNDSKQTKVQSDLITFNQRYSQMTYDGYHFSQLGSLYNLTLNVRF